MKQQLRNLLHDLKLALGLPKGKMRNDSIRDFFVRLRNFDFDKAKNLTLTYHQTKGGGFIDFDIEVVDESVGIDIFVEARLGKKIKGTVTIVVYEISKGK
ncbi:hypothetical protein H7X65_01560 [Candidatus Parcubacteria bacterium]|nr:hypothetical protein [Candidatus Parcubacteria bacterium]